MSPSKPNLQSVEDAVSLAKFAHKYDVTDLVYECESYLVITANVDRGSALFSVVEAVMSLLMLAASCCMNTLLAHCELFMIRQEDKSLWQHPALLSDKISRQCLLRLLRGAQRHMVNSEAEVADLQAQVKAHRQLSPKIYNSGMRVLDPAHEVKGDRHISINTLKEWAKAA